MQEPLQKPAFSKLSHTVDFPAPDIPVSPYIFLFIILFLLKVLLS